MLFSFTFRRHTDRGKTFTRNDLILSRIMAKVKGEDEKSKIGCVRIMRVCKRDSAFTFTLSSTERCGSARCRHG